MQITAAGSLPGTDFAGALSTMAELLPEYLPWPELPARGPGSQMTGRALGVIEGLDFELTSSGWRLTSAPTKDQRRARAQWRDDLDIAEEQLQAFQGKLKLALAGPWTLCATVEAPRGELVLADPGARRELSQALSDSAHDLLAVLARRFPQAEIRLQVDEPVLVAVSEGSLRTASGLHRHRRIEDRELAEALKLLTDTPITTILHCCAAGAWAGHARQADFDAVAFDAQLATSSSLLDPLSEWADQGKALILGLVDTGTTTVQPADLLVRRGLELVERLDVAAEQLTLGTACGFANWRPSDVTSQLRELSRAAELLSEQLAE